MLAELCQALSHPVRVRLLEVLIARQSCVCEEIVEVASLSQHTILEHLKILKRAGFVQGEVNGSKRCYCFNPERL